MKIILSLLLCLSTGLLHAGSADNRQGKNVQITAQGGFDYRMSTYQAGVYTFLGRDDLLGLKGGTGKSGDDRQTVFALQWKHFFGGSFYLAPEIYYINYIEYDDDNCLFCDDERYTAMGAGVRIGNQWQFKNFTLGCDWFGLGRNIVHWERDEDFFGSPYTVTLLNFYLGVSF